MFKKTALFLRVGFPKDAGIVNKVDNKVYRNAVERIFFVQKSHLSTGATDRRLDHHVFADRHKNSSSVGPRTNHRSEGAHLFLLAVGL